MKIALITGAAGLIGSESVHFLHDKFDKIIGIDNDMRSYFFGKEASTSWNQKQLETKYIKRINANEEFVKSKRESEDPDIIRSINGGNAKGVGVHSFYQLDKFLFQYSFMYNWITNSKKSKHRHWNSSRNKG